MSIDIVGIGTFRTAFENKDNKEFEKLEKYHNLAKIHIGALAHPDLARTILADQDAVANIAFQIMIGDLRWDKNREKTKTRDSYLMDCSYWAIGKYTRRLKNQMLHPISLDHKHINHNGQGQCLRDQIQAPATGNPAVQAELNDTKRYLKDLLDSDVLTDMQRSNIKMRFFDEMTLKEIAAVQNRTHQAISMSIESGLALLKDAISNDYA
jgi:hypothetical protein